MTRSYRKFYDQNPPSQRVWEKRYNKARRRRVNQILHTEGQDVELLPERRREFFDPWATPRDKSPFRKWVWKGWYDADFVRKYMRK